MRTNKLDGAWHELLGHAKEQWAKLTDDEFRRIDGKRDVLEGLIQQKYGLTQEQASRQIDDWSDKISENKHVMGSNYGDSKMLAPKIKHAFLAETLLNENGTIIEVETSDSKVILKGLVPSELLKTLATDITVKVMEDNDATQPLENLLHIQS